MRFDTQGPIEVPRNVLGLKAKVAAKFWAEANERLNPGLPEACGCYVFAIRAGKGARPWYVGKAEKQSFRNECFNPTNRIKFHELLEGRKGTPLLYFYPKMNDSGMKFASVRKTGNSSIIFLENMLIGMALERNSNLLNVSNTKMLKNLIVPGLINSGKGKLKTSAKDLKMLMGY